MILSFRKTQRKTEISWSRRIFRKNFTAGPSLNENYSGPGRHSVKIPSCRDSFDQNLFCNGPTLEGNRWRKSRIWHPFWGLPTHFRLKPEVIGLKGILTNKRLFEGKNWGNRVRWVMWRHQLWDPPTHFRLKPEVIGFKGFQRNKW